MRKLLRRLLFLGLLSAAAYAVWKKVAAGAARGPDTLSWQSQPAPFPPAPVAATAPGRPAPEGWVEPDDGGACPASHPVKAKTGSGIFHVPGGQNYERTHADRCYTDPSAAEADGLRRAKR